MLDLELIDAPTEALLTPEELRHQCNVDDVGEDSLLASYLLAATAHLDGYAGILGRAIAPQTWRLHLERFPSGRSIRLPLPPLRSVDGVTYLDADGATQTLAPSVYTVLDGERAEIALGHGQSWPAARCQARSIAITFSCGWEPTDNVWPNKVEPIRQALRLMVAAMYERREDWAEIPAGLLRPLRLTRL